MVGLGSVGEPFPRSSHCGAASPGGAVPGKGGSPSEAGSSSGCPNPASAVTRGRAIVFDINPIVAGRPPNSTTLMFDAFGKGLSELE
jgi:hypothetical protein